MSEQAKDRRIGIRVDNEFHEKLEHLARSQRRKLSDVVRIILEDEMTRYESALHEDQEPFGSRKESAPPKKSKKGVA